MDWSQVLFLFLANTSLIVWFRSESREDWRHMDSKLEASLKGIRDEMRDFHDRLCKIEERNKR
jgi:hypothetical protein